MFEKIATLDFTSERKAMSTIVLTNGTKKTLLKGAPDRILKKCTSYNSLDGCRSMTEQDRQSLAQQIGEMAA